MSISKLRKKENKERIENGELPVVPATNDKEITEMVELILLRRAQLSNVNEIVHELKTLGYSHLKASTLVQATVDTYERMSNDYAIEILGQVRSSLSQVMRQADNLLRRAEDYDEELDALELKAKLISLAQKLLPTRIDITTNQEIDMKRALIQSYSLEEDTFEAEPTESE